MNSPTGPKTIHFWGPIANWGFVISVFISYILQGMYDINKSPKYISKRMTGGKNKNNFNLVLCVYSMLFMRFAWMVQPRNYLLLACHVANETVQVFQLSRVIRYEYIRILKQKRTKGATKGSMRGATIIARNH